ncbi:MAG: hypothetical protein JWP86_33 [Phenylobacterium sp.]|nr:hypothetical protein [Phenylobacterium sp.]MDB5492696.1 hypothetical protein [Phenylobacterium sp.]
MTKAPLSDIGAEQVRDLRARLGRVPKGALGDKSVGPLSKGFFDVCARVGLEVLVDGTQPASPGELLEAVEAADMAGLQKLVTGLHAIRAANPSGWRAWMDQGCLQAVLRRRLVLAGRLPPSEV